MFTKIRVLSVMVLLVISLLLSACAGATPSVEQSEPGGVVATQGAAPAEAEPLIIGAVFNQTGWMAAYDGPPRDAAFLAVKVLNEKGGILGRPVRIIEIDGKTDPAVVGTATRQLIQQGAEVIIAPCDFDIGAPASQAAQEAGLVGISMCASSPLYGSAVLGDKQFTASVWNNNMAGAAAEWAYAEKDWRTAAVITDSAYEYTQSLGDLFKEHWATLGGTIVSDDAYSAGDEEFSAQINRILALGEQPDVIYISGMNPELATVLRQVRAAGIDLPIMGGDTYDDVELWATLGPSLGNNIYFATHAFLGPEAGGNMEEFLELYEAEYGDPPEAGFTVMGWDTVMVYAQAIEAAGTTEGSAVAKKIEDLEFKLLSGTMNWSSAADGHFPNKEVAIVELHAAEPSFIMWTSIENPPGR